MPTTPTPLNIYSLIREALEKAPNRIAVMPPCADVLLSLVRGTTPKEIIQFFRDYFRFNANSVFPPGTDFTTGDFKLDGDLRTCLTPTGGGVAAPAALHFPPHSCMPHVCLRLEGDRHGGTKPAIDRLFIADLVWLFYIERMGTFQILGAILDDYATNGSFPVSSQTLPAFVAEVMIREMKMGSSSYLRERVTAYRRGIGWKLPHEPELKVESSVNTAFTQQFHKFLQGALSFYREKRLANAITSTTTGTPSVATRTELVETITLLRHAFDPFEYGRVYQDALVGIIWAVASMALLFELKDDLGIPTSYDQPREFIPAAYDMLVAKRPIASDSNRFTTHVSCANTGRMLMLSVEGLPVVDDDHVKAWLENEQTEAMVETYRTAYRNLTGLDLGNIPAGSAVTVEQRA